MSSMGAAAVAAGGAGAVGIAAMGSAGGMGTMGDVGASSMTLTRAFDSLGLGIFNMIPNQIAQPLLFALLAMSVVLAYIAYRVHRALYVPILSLASAILMYLSIYVWMSELFYLTSFAGMIAASVLGLVAARRREETFAAKSLSNNPHPLYPPLPQQRERGS